MYDRKTITLLLLLPLWLTVQAGVVTQEAARVKAARFLSGLRAAGARGTETVRQGQLHAVAVPARCHVFNAEGGGFVIVSADDRCADILGYSTVGSVPERGDSLPPGLRGWLEACNHELQLLDDQPDNAASRMTTGQRRSVSAAKTPVSPLLTCRWNQGAPYNAQCPLDGSVHSVTGCVATAMAQVLYYHRMENSRELGATEAYTESGKTVEALPATTLDWSLLIDDYSDTYTETQQQAVATLMQYAGAAVKMDYSASLSTALAKDIPAAFCSCFGYDADVAVAHRNDYTYDDWVDLVYGELATNGPVLYTGQSAGGGHAFVVDGYEEDDFFHVNWGWGGTADGYFKLSVMNPYDQGIGGSTSKSGFDFMQDIIVNVHPQDDGISETVPTATAGSGKLSVVSGSWKLGGNGTAIVGSPTTVLVTIQNTDSEDYDGDIRLGAVPVSKKSVFGYTTYLPTGEAGVILSSQWGHLATGETKEISYTFTPTAAKMYAIAPLDKSIELSSLSGSALLSLLSNYTTLTISSGSASNQLSVNGGLTIGNEQPSSSAFYDTGLRLSFTLRNSGAVAYGDGVLVRLLGGGSTRNVLCPSDICASGTQTFEASFTGLTAGTSYNVQVCYGGGTLIAQYGPYTCQAGVTSYDADGRPSGMAPATALTVEADALAVDLTGCGVTEVTPNGNPNTLYFIGSGDNMPEGLADCNVVRDGTAATLSLIDGYDFYTPQPFTATTATYTRRFTTGADGRKGWTTMMLPFDVSEVRCGERVIDWFHGPTDGGKHFWVKAFAAENDGKVLFDYANDISAGMPYIVAVPGSKWGEAWDLTGRDITFVSEPGCQIISGGSGVTGRDLKFTGSTRHEDVADVYVTNDEGTAFVVTQDGSDAFRAYFQPFSSLPLAALGIGSVDRGTTAIEEAPCGQSAGQPETYDLSGRRVKNPRKGLYISHGKIWRK